MRKYQPAIDRTPILGSRFDAIVEYLLIGLLAFMPIAFGVVHSWSEEIVIILSGAIVLCFLLKLALNRGQGIIWSWAYVPVGLFLLVAVFQLVRFPTSAINIISPNTAATKTELLGDLPNAKSALKTMTLSFYPHATEHDLRIVLAIAGVFVVVINIFRRPEQVKRLLMGVAIIGGFIAILTLAQNLFGNGKIYWFISSSHCKGYSGPFVNHSNYGQFMNLSIGAALAMVMFKLHQVFRSKKITLPAVFEYLSSSSAKPLWLLVAIMSIATASVFVSLTRGGMIGMLIAIIFTALLATQQRSLKGHNWIMVVMALAAFVCVLYIGFDAVYDRLASLRNFHEAESGRLQILKDIAIALTRFPILGTGLGTYSVVYPMFDRSTIVALAAHAENEYAQVLEETGMVGFGLLVIFGIIIWLNYSRAIRANKEPIQSAAYGLGFGILAILIHSLTDFGQHLPANAFLSAIFCALLVSLARKNQPANRKRKNIIEAHYQVPLVFAVLTGAIFAWIWAIVGTNNARLAEISWKKVVAAEERLVNKNWQATHAEYADLISHARAASAYQPGNVKYRYWLNVYRWRSISQTIDPNTGDAVIQESSTAVVGEIVNELDKARVICPTYGPIYSVVGQIEKFVLNDSSGSEKIKKGFHLAPCDPIACFVAGRLDAIEGNTQDCIEKFQKAMQLDASLFPAIVTIYINYLSRPDLAISAAGDDIGRLNHIANVLDEMQYNDLTEQVLEKIKHLLEVKCSQPNATAPELATLANIFRKQGENKAAIECYQRALALDYGQVEWRLDLARLLAQMQRIPEAMREARVCLQVRPQLQAAQKLIGDLSVHPAVISESTVSP